MKLSVQHSLSDERLPRHTLRPSIAKVSDEADMGRVARDSGIVDVHDSKLVCQRKGEADVARVGHPVQDAVAEFGVHDDAVLQPDEDGALEDAAAGKAFNGCYSGFENGKEGTLFHYQDNLGRV